MKLSVIIVSYNVRHYLSQCLDSVWRSARAAHLETEVLVVDNNSKDDTVAALTREYASFLTKEGCEGLRLQLIVNRVNAGFGRANNQALQHSTGDYVLFLNPDTIITERTFADCVEEAKRHNDLGAIGVRMLYADGRFARESRRGLPTPWVAFCKMSGLGSLFPKSRTFGRYYMGFLPEDQAVEIDIVSGAFMFCSRRALAACGGFDEAFFMYGEDIDLSYRFRKAGFRNVYVPTSIIHYKGESTQKNSFRYVHVFYQAMLIFFRKHFPKVSMLLSVPVHVAIYARAIGALITGQIRAFKNFMTPYRQKVISAVFVGENEDFEVLAACAETWGLHLMRAESLRELPKSDILILSNASYGFDRMIDAVEASPRLRQLAIFYPEASKLILARDVYTPLP